MVPAFFPFVNLSPEYPSAFIHAMGGLYHKNFRKSRSGIRVDATRRYSSDNLSSCTLQGNVFSRIGREYLSGTRTRQVPHFSLLPKFGKRQPWLPRPGSLCSICAYIKLIRDILEVHALFCIKSETPLPGHRFTGPYGTHAG